MSEPVCIVPAGDWTGEGAVWSEDEKALYWVDISRFLIHRLDVRSGSTRSWFFDEPACALALTDRPDTMIVALASQVILWQPANDARTVFAKPEGNWPEARMNDGRADPAGNFWVGSMRNNVGPDGGNLDVEFDGLGRLFRVRGNGAHNVELTDIGISNTLCWSPHADLFFFGDTVTNEISVWDYDLSSGAISHKRPYFSGFDRGLPDGSAMDRDGYLWNARYGGACLVRVAPDGSVDRIIEMPVSNITTCAFGGPQLRTLYITTARGGDGPAERLGGGLFAMAVETPGLPENIFKLS
jgi:sugar lactone lactonase YvrE